jgi:hypothetical protein
MKFYLFAIRRERRELLSVDTRSNFAELSLFRPRAILSSSVARHIFPLSLFLFGDDSVWKLGAMDCR